MPLTYFTVIADFKAIVARSVLETNPDPFIQAVTGLVYFAPTVTQVFSEADKRIYQIEPLTGRIDNGVLKLIRGMALDETIPEEEPGEPADPKRYGVRLTANSDALGPLPSLDYRVSFSKVVFNRRDQKLPSFQFPAPADDEIVDLATVHRRTRARA